MGPLLHAGGAFASVADWVRAHPTPVTLTLLAVVALLVAFTALYWRRYQALRREVDRRTAAEQALQLNMQRYRSLFDNNPLGTYAFDLEGNFTAANPACTEITGHTVDDLLTMHFGQVLAEGWEEQTHAAFLQAVAGEPSLVDTVIHHKDGHLVELQVQAMPIVIAGEVAGVYGIARDMTEQNRLDAQLSRAWAALESAIDSIVIVDADGDVEYINPAGARLYGYADGAEVVGMPWTSLAAPDDMERLAPVIADALASRGEWRGESLRKRLDGTVFPADLSITRLPSGEMVSVARDVTERKRAENALRTSEERYRKILEQIQDGYFEVDLAGDLTFCNDALANIVGHTMLSIRGLNPRDFTDPATADRIHATFHRVFTTGEPNPGFDWVLETDDGRRVAVETSVSLMRDAEGNPVGFRGIMRDVTARKDAEEALRVSEQRYRLVTQATKETIWDADLVTGRTRWQGAIEEMFGHPELPEFDAAWFEAQIHPDDRARFVAEQDAFFNSSDEVWLTELRLRRRDGAYTQVLCRGIALRDENGRAVRMVGSMMDISERKRHELEMQKAQQQAEAANRAKSEFLANVSHEIRTPMNGVIGMTDLLLTTELDPRQREYADTVRRSGDSLLRIINDILDFSQIEAGKLRVDDLAYDVRAVVDETVALFIEPARAAGLELTSTVDPAVPALLRGDPGRVKQVLMNLVGNAVKFTEQGQVSVTVTVDGDPARMVVRVGDTGIGLTEEQQGRLFQSFSQADASTTRRYGGTGLGLAISKQLTDLMGGRIWVDSEFGVGSTFGFELPLRPAQDQTGTTPRRTSPSARAQPVPSTRDGTAAGRVLVAEDNAVNQRVTAAMVERLGFAVEVAGDGERAVELLRTGEYAAVLMDVQMPGMDGFAATRAIRSHEAGSGGARTPVIAMTANARAEDTEKALAAGMDAYLVKPVRAHELTRTLVEWVGGVADAAGGDRSGNRSPAIDQNLLEELQELSRDTGEDLFGRLVRTLLEDTPTRLSAMADALARHDIEELAGIAHALRGSAGSMGARVMSEICGRIEDAADIRDLDRIPTLLELLQGEFVRASAELHDVLSRSDTEMVS